jgi:hypothetical protein
MTVTNKPIAGYRMHTSDSIFSASSPKNVSHQSQLLGLWQHLMVQSGCLANPLKKSPFSRCVNPIAIAGESTKETVKTFACGNAG